MSEQQPRPGQTTLAGSVIIAGSVIVVLSAWQRVSALTTLEVQEDLQGMLGGDSIFASLGWSVDDLATGVRILCLIGAGAATAATVLGFQVFKRSRSARIALTVLAPLLLVGGLAIQGFFAPMVAAAIAMLWLQPTRDWYAGRPWMQRFEQRRAERVAAFKQAGQPRQGRADAPGAPPAAPSVHDALGRATPTTPMAPAQIPPPPLHQAPHRPPAGERPSHLVSVCVVTWVISGLVLLALGVLAAVLPFAADDLLDEARKEQPEMFRTYDPTTTDLLVGLYVLIGFLLIWAVVAIVLAWLAFTGHNWARVLLAVSAFCAAVPALLASVSAWPLVLLVAALAGSGWVLLRPEVAAWYRR